MQIGDPGPCKNVSISQVEKMDGEKYKMNNSLHLMSL